MHSIPVSEEEYVSERFEDIFQLRAVQVLWDLWGLVTEGPAIVSARSERSRPEVVNQEVDQLS